MNKGLLALSGFGAVVALSASFVAINAALFSAHYFSAAVQLRKQDKRAMRNL